jgi:hypothetical protein
MRPPGNGSAPALSKHATHDWLGASMSSTSPSIDQAPRRCEQIA